jgi:hypothetical protein
VLSSQRKSVANYRMLFFIDLSGLEGGGSSGGTCGARAGEEAAGCSPWRWEVGGAKSCTSLRCS